MKDRFRQEGKGVIITGENVGKKSGTKAERINGILMPRYENGTILHGKGGLFLALEEELVLSKPEHDDLKDALAAAVEISKPMISNRFRATNNVINFDARFGGRY